MRKCLGHRAPWCLSMFGDVPAEGEQVMKFFKLPDLGEGLAEAEIVEWKVSAGDTVQVDQPEIGLSQHYHGLLFGCKIQGWLVVFVAVRDQPSKQIQHKSMHTPVP